MHHLTGGGKKEGVVTCDTMLRLANAEAVELRIDGGASVIVRSGRAPIVDGQEERRMRVGCGSATIGIFANQWLGHADEVIVVDDHITGVLTEHQAGRFLDMRPAGIRVRGRRSTPGRYFQVANPGMGPPLLSLASISAPLASRKSATSLRSFFAARCKGVMPHFVSGGNQARILFDQLLHLCQVAFFGCAMNGVAVRGQPTPSAPFELKL